MKNRQEELFQAIHNNNLEQLFQICGKNNPGEGQDLILQELVSGGIDVNARDKEGKTPLRIAAESGHIEIVQCLVKAGADVNAPDKEGITPLHMAAYYNVEIAQYLIEAGADVNAVTNDGGTPLHGAAVRHVETVQYLINAGAKVSAKAEFGQTPLCIAAGYKTVKTIQCLIKAGADVGELGTNFIVDTSIARTLSIATVVQNLCKLQGDKNTIELDNVTKEELAFAKEIITIYLSNHGITNDLCAHLEKFAPEYLKKDILGYVKECISNYNQDLLILDGLLLGETKLGETEGIQVPYNVLLSAQKNGVKISGGEKKILALYETYPEYKVPGVYLLDTIAEEVEGVSILNQLMLRDQHIAELVIDLSKRILPKDIKLKLEEAVVKHQLYKVFPGFEELTNPAPLNLQAELPLETEADEADEAGKSVKALGDSEDLLD